MMVLEEELLLVGLAFSLYAVFVLWATLPNYE